MNAWKKWRMCGRKKSFETESKANKNAKKNDLRVYHCPVCFCWHTTKKEPK